MHDHHEEEDEAQRDNIPFEGVFTDLFEAKIEPPKWLIKDILPVGLSGIIGPPKIAQKSTLGVGLALGVADIPVSILPPFLNVVERTGPVLMFSSEATAGEVRYTVETGLGVKGHTGAIYVADDPGEWRMDDKNAFTQMMSWIRKVDPRLVVIDVLRDFHELDEKESLGLNRMLRPLRKWAKEAESGILVVHHTRKLAEGAGEYGFEDARGSSAFFALLDGLIVISPKEDGTKKLKGYFKRAGQWEYRVTFGCFGDTAKEYISAEDKKVLGILEKGTPGNYPSAEDVARVMQKSKEQVLQAMNKLERNGLWRRK